MGGRIWSITMGTLTKTDHIVTCNRPNYQLQDQHQDLKRRQYYLKWTAKTWRPQLYIMIWSRRVRHFRQRRLWDEHISWCQGQRQHPFCIFLAVANFRRIHFYLKSIIPPQSILHQAQLWIFDSIRILARRFCSMHAARLRGFPATKSSTSNSLTDEEACSGRMT